AGAAVPVAVLVVLVQRRLAQGAVAGLVVELGGPEPGADPREALSRALGDPSLAVGYLFAAGAPYLGRKGGAACTPAPRRRAPVHGGGTSGPAGRGADPRRGA